MQFFVIVPVSFFYFACLLCLLTHQVYIYVLNKTIDRQLLDCGGVHRLMVITSHSSKYDTKVFNVASRVRFTPFNFV